MPLSALRASGRLMAFARAVLARARPRVRSSAALAAANAPTMPRAPRRMLPRHDLAEIDALRLLIRPAFAAAMKRSAPSGKVHGTSP
jgi:hypothetical protein